MTKQIIAFLFASILQLAVQGQPALHQDERKLLVKGMVIHKSILIKPGVYKIEPADDMQGQVILIEGDNIIIDFNKADLRGSNKKPDEFTGVAIRVRNSRNVTIKNLHARGYKVALLASNTTGLIIDDCDFSYNYRQHLNSSPEKEDVSDWMSYHHNENDEWLRYGAAIYLHGCDSAIIKNCLVTGGQNGLMMTQCNEGMIYNNDFSFNSGIGIGFYRSSRNKVMYNAINFNVRGYSHGVYNRGQDSAGILVYEQSDHNFFYKNSVTHSGDGFFLWAGQTTMDSGEGGCNDNVVMGNDFSYAPANGVEVTFSRNVISGNRLFECDYGIWGGYSYASNFSNNKFRDNRIDIAIEHGQQNKITYNVFYESKEAVRLWGNPESSDWGYPKHRDTRSQDYLIAYNNFGHCKTVLHANQTDSLNVFGNIYGVYDQLFQIDSTITGLDTTVNEELGREISMDTTVAIPDVAAPKDPFKDMGLLAGRKNIIITEWGPYDFRSPIIWNTNPVDSGGTMKFNLLGPKGKWVIKSYKGVSSISSMSGEFPASITAQKLPGDRIDISIELEYKGSKITTLFGETIPPGKAYLFSFRK